MALNTKDIFPGLDELIPGERLQRVDNAIGALFDRTLTILPDGSPFIITGDIPAMWLRDSTFQVKPLLNSKHPEIIELLIEISKSQMRLFLIDPYANAFNPGPTGNCWHKDFAEQSPWVFERKFELDSWAAILHLARMIHEKYGRNDHMQDTFGQALDLMIDLAIREQHHDPTSYRFKRENQIPHDSLSHDGYGAPTGYTGMVYSAFRPSDDACTYGYLVPSNLYFLRELEGLSEEFKTARVKKLIDEVKQGIEKFAIIEGRYAYEVDGLGNALFIDDANVPSLLSLPYLDISLNTDQIYQSTRKFILSSENPYYFIGKKAAGIGSQHTPIHHIWPISIAIQGLTDANSDSAGKMLELLEKSDGGTGSMHESFHVDDDQIFTREWFSWADMTYVELVLKSVNYSSIK
ncbi:MAG: glycoside hydrolase family 125 protein [Candidatus Planktophila sp.]